MKVSNMTLHLSEKTCEQVYVLTDFSPSMDEDDYEPTRREGAILAIKEFLAIKAELYPQDMVGLIGFDEKAHVLHHHISVGLSLLSLLQSLKKTTSFSSGTNFTAALSLAEKCLSGQKCPQSENRIAFYLRDFLFESVPKGAYQTTDKGGLIKRIILLSDGQHNGGGFPTRVAQRLKDSGIIIECIGIAGCPDEVDEKMLKAIASRDGQGHPLYSFIGDTHQLVEKYKSMAHHIRAI